MLTETAFPKNNNPTPSPRAEWDYCLGLLFGVMEAFWRQQVSSRGLISRDLITLAMELASRKAFSALVLRALSFA